MASTITFTDAEGAATLDNGKPAPGDRFAAWAPRTILVGPKHHALGTGTRYAFTFREDYGATFELRHIPHSDMAVMERLVRHLDGGGEITVNTGDAGTRSYTCILAPEADLPHPELTDAALLEYTMRFSVLSTGTSPMLCIWP